MAFFNSPSLNIDRFLHGKLCERLFRTSYNRKYYERTSEASEWVIFPIITSAKNPVRKQLSMMKSIYFITSVFAWNDSSVKTVSSKCKNCFVQSQWRKVFLHCKTVFHTAVISWKIHFLWNKIEFYAFMMFTMIVNEHYGWCPKCVN